MAIWSASDKDIEYVPRVVKEEHDQHDEHAKNETDFAEASDADLNSTDDGDCSKSCDAPNDDDLVCDGVLNVAVKPTQTAIELDCTNSKACAHSKHGSNDRQDVHSVTQNSKYLVAYQRVETRAHGHGQSSVVGHITEQETHNHVNNPSMNTPVKVCDIKSILSPLIIIESEQNKS